MRKYRSCIFFREREIAHPSALFLSSGNNNDRTDMEDYVASLLGDDFLV